jgi:hypothetical protein
MNAKSTNDILEDIKDEIKNSINYTLSHILTVNTKSLRLQARLIETLEDIAKDIKAVKKHITDKSDE